MFLRPCRYFRRLQKRYTPDPELEAALRAAGTHSQPQGSSEDGSDDEGADGVVGDPSTRTSVNCINLLRCSMQVTLTWVWTTSARCMVGCSSPERWQSLLCFANTSSCCLDNASCPALQLSPRMLQMYWVQSSMVQSCLTHPASWPADTPWPCLQRQDELMLSEHFSEGVRAVRKSCPRAPIKVLNFDWHGMMKVRAQFRASPVWCPCALQ